MKYRYVMPEGMFKFLKQRKLKRLQSQNEKYQRYLDNMIAPYFLARNDCATLSYVGLEKYLLRGIYVNNLEIQKLKEGGAKLAGAIEQPTESEAMNSSSSSDHFKSSTFESEE